MRGLAAEAMRGTAPAVVNAANEVAVAAFLDGRMNFGGIPAVIEGVLARHAAAPVSDLAAVLEADAWARSAAGELCAMRATGGR